METKYDYKAQVNRLEYAENLLRDALKALAAAKRYDAAHGAEDGGEYVNAVDNVGGALRTVETLKIAVEVLVQ